MLVFGILVTLVAPARRLNAHQILIVQEEKSAILVDVFNLNAGLTLTVMLMKNVLAMSANLLTVLQVRLHGNTAA